MTYRVPPTKEEQVGVDYIRSNLKGKLLDDDKYPLNEVTFLCFLRQKKGNAEKALKLLEESIAWRCEYKPHRIEFSEVEDWAKKGVALATGFTVNGVPTVYIEPRSGLPVDIDQRVRCQLWQYEELLRRGYQEWVVVADFSKIESAPTDKEKKVREEMDEIRRKNYPLFDSKVLFCGMPLFIRAVFAVITAMMSSAEKETMETGLSRKDLLKWIKKEDLLERHGGSRVVAQKEDGTFDVLSLMQPPRQ